MVQEDDNELLCRKSTCRWKAQACAWLTRPAEVGAREGKVASEPEALLRWFAGQGFELTRIGLEAGPLSQWLFGPCSKVDLRWSSWRRGMCSMRWRRLR